MNIILFLSKKIIEKEKKIHVIILRKNEKFKFRILAR